MSKIKSKLMITSAFAVLLAMIFSIVGCSREEPNQVMISTDKYFYAISLSFQFRAVFEGEVTISPIDVFARHLVFPEGEHFDPSNEFVLVHNEAEAANLPDNVVAAWPRYAQGMVNGIMFFVYHNEIDLSEFGLTHPVTVTDLVDNWEQVNELWNSPVMRQAGAFLRGDIFDVVRFSGEDVYLNHIIRFKELGSNQEAFREDLQRRTGAIIPRQR